ncbi:MAG: hypothetical protein CMB76_06835 [Euryarchaeota archaeon]|nr:hypothetical protein [Euryarchaeota archaeon]
MTISETEIHLKLKNRKRDRFVISKLKTHLSRKQWVGYTCEIRKGSNRGPTAAYIAEEGIGGSAFIDINFDLFTKEVLTDIENYIWHNCYLDYMRYMTECHTGLDINDIDFTDKKLIRYLAPFRRAWLDRDVDKCELYDGLINWWTQYVATNHYYSKKNRK